MIVVTVHLASAVDGQVQQLARMHICNDGEATLQNPRLGDYVGETFIGRDAETLAKGRASKRATVTGWRRHDFHVWNLVRRMLDALGYDKGAPRATDLPLIDLPAGDFQALADAPRDGTEVELLIVHVNAMCSSDPVGGGWVEVVRGHWIDHNHGGWTWNGLAGVIMGWRPIGAAGC